MPSGRRRRSVPGAAVSRPGTEVKPGARAEAPGPLPQAAPTIASPMIAAPTKAVGLVAGLGRGTISGGALRELGLGSAVHSRSSTVVESADNPPDRRRALARRRRSAWTPCRSMHSGNEPGQARCSARLRPNCTLSTATSLGEAIGACTRREGATGAGSFGPTGLLGCERCWCHQGGGIRNAVALEEEFGDERPRGAAAWIRYVGRGVR